MDLQRDSRITEGSRLALVGLAAMIRRMNFLAAIGVLALFAGTMATGVVLAVKGSPWLLLASFGAFLFLFGKLGCLRH